MKAPLTQVKGAFLVFTVSQTSFSEASETQKSQLLCKSGCALSSTARIDKGSIILRRLLKKKSNYCLSVV